MNSLGVRLMMSRVGLLRIILVAGLCFAVGGAKADEHSQAAGKESAASRATTVVFWESGFPAADTAAPTREQIGTMLPGAAIADASHLAEGLAAKETRLLVMPYGSAFPEEDWD